MTMPPAPLRRRRGDALLAQSTLLEEQPAPAALRWGAVAVVALVAAFLVWAALAPFAQIVRAAGEVEATVPLQRVQHLEGGIVAELLVTDGQRVEAGELLLRLDTRALKAERGQLAVRAQALALDLERLEALLAGRSPDFTAVPGATATMLAAQIALFEGQRLAEESRRSVLESQIASARAEIASQRRLLADAGLRLSMIGEQQAARRNLAQSGAQSRMQLIEVELRHSDAESEVRRLEGDLERHAGTIAETRRRLAELDAQSRATHLTQRAAVLRDMAELAEAIEQIDDRLDRARVLAPASGIVMVAFAETVGGVLAPGADVARIAPEGAGLRIRARIAPREIGWVAPGDAVKLRLPALDFAEAPPLEGRLAQILPGTVPDDAGQPQFTAFITLEDTAALEARGVHLLPGMAAQVDILAGDRTLLDYLFRPMQHLRARLFTQP